MATEKAFLVKLESGEELGPMDTDALVKMAENGTITACAPHDELLRISPTSREIYESQNKTSMKGGSAV